MKRELVKLLVSLAIVAALVVVGCAPAAAPEEEAVPEEEGAPEEEEEEAAAPEVEVVEWRMPAVAAVGAVPGSGSSARRQRKQGVSPGRMAIVIPVAPTAPPKM